MRSPVSICTEEKRVAEAECFTSTEPATESAEAPEPEGIEKPEFDTEPDATKADTGNLFAMHETCTILLSF